MGSEEPYDKARAEELRKAVEKTGCYRLDADEQVLKKKYKDDKKVSEAFEKAKQLPM